PTHALAAAAPDLDAPAHLSVQSVLPLSRRAAIFILMQPSLVDGAGGGKWQKVAHRAVVARLGGLAGKLMNREVEVSAFQRVTDEGPDIAACPKSAGKSRRFILPPRRRE